MSFKFRQFLISSIVYFASLIGSWMLAFFFLLAFQVQQNNAISLTKLSDISNALWSGLFAGIIWGVIFYFVRRLRAYISYYWLAVAVSVFANISSAYLLIYSMYYLKDLFMWDDFPNDMNQLLNLYNSQLFFSILAYFFVVGTLIEIFHEIDKKFGKGVLIKVLIGRYYKPKENYRVFLFMDLKSSTFYAENLGHFKYSRLIQDCFKDISAAIRKNQGEIYQFVGDEVVITWKHATGVEQNRCLQLFFDFQQIIMSREAYYQKNYGMIPVFKAGIHTGKVMVAEVGDLKTEIAYHGDAINTASRIQALCNTYNAQLLVSGSVIHSLKQNKMPDVKISYLGEVLLTGKQIKTAIYSVSNS